jgi:hypothetical protein
VVKTVRRIGHKKHEKSQKPETKVEPLIGAEDQAKKNPSRSYPTPENSHRQAFGGATDWLQHSFAPSLPEAEETKRGVRQKS